jgi:hypothetical protein
MKAIQRFTAVVLLPLAGYLLLVHFSAGCEGEDFLASEDSEISGRVLLLQTASPPPMDDPRDDIWKRAVTGLIELTDVDATDSASLNSRTLGVKGIVSQGRLYIRAEWVDASYSARANPIVANDTIVENVPPEPPDTLTLWQRAPSSQLDQDRLAIIWDVGNNGAEAANCYTMCHADGDRSPAGDRMYTTGGGNVDVWHWMVAGSDPVLLAQDEYWSANGRDLDAPGVAIAHTNFDQANEAPFFTHEDQTAFSGNFLKSTDTTTFDPDFPWPDNFSVPGYWLDVNASGSITDVASFSSYNTSISSLEWLVVMSRAMSTGNGDDIDFTQVQSGDSVMVTVATMNNSGSLHIGSQPFYLIFP